MPGDHRPRGDEDRGTTLVLVLLLVVVAGLVIVPLMTYATSVLRLNTAVSERSKDVEASKAGLRIALTDPSGIFTTCDDGGTLDSVDLNGTNVSTTCAELAEVGPLDALGFEVPIGAVATQLGAEVPATAVGGTLQSDPVPSYPLSADWWSAHIPVTPAEPWDAVSGSIWMPELPAWPSTPRTDVPFDMPAGFDTTTGIECKVFFPGRYDQPLTLGDDTATGSPVYYYFASGVYYFDQPITVHENADVVVGFGLQDFVDRPADQRSECADDLQVATSVVNGPATFAIDGGGSTWVFGDDAQLIVDDSAGSPSIRFNQRYTEEDRGGRISIMTVNGVKNGATADPHDVPLVNLIPGSQELDTVDPDNDISVAFPIDADRYVPSAPTFTDAARPPAAPGASIDGRRHRVGSDDRGGILLTWDEPRGNDAGGSLITNFLVTVSDGVGDVCDQPGDIVFTDGGGTSPNTLSCYIAGLDEDEDYDVTVTTVNGVGSGAPAILSVETEDSGPRDDVPDAPTGVTLEETDTDDVARVTWTPGASPDVPITGYTATLSKIVGAAAHPELPPRMFFSTPSYVELIGYSPIGYRIATVDPNGEGTTLTELDLTQMPVGWSVVPTSEVDLLITPPPTGAPTPFDAGTFFNVTYEVSDPDGFSETKNLTIGWVGAYSGGVSPDPDAKTFDAYVSANPAAPSVFELPFTHQRGEAAEVSGDSIASLPAGWNATRVGNAITVWTSLTDGSTATLTYDVTELNDTGTDTATITLIAPTGSSTPVVVDSCTVSAEPWFPTAQSCEIAAADLGPGETGFVAEVTAHSAIGDSAASAVSATRSANFDGGGTAASLPPERVVDPWTPQPIIDIRASGAGAARVRIAGYVAIPMGRIRVDNPDADDNDTIELVGGIVAGTYDLVDPADGDTIIGFLNDIVLQRKVRITSTAGSTRSTAVIQVNEDGSYAINSWVVD